MRRVSATLGSALFLVVAPGTVALFLPWLITRWQWPVGPTLQGVAALRCVGGILIAAGLPVLLDSFWRFASQGLGTPAPIAPPTHLVVTGLYRWVRNPMYVAVLFLILGQGLFFGSTTALAYGLVMWAVFHAFVCLYEEPTLREKFGPQYATYCAHVRRWLPRLRPWPGA